MGKTVKKSRKKRLLWLIPAVLVLVLTITVALPQGRSVLVMSIYSKMNERDSLEAETGLYVQLPGGFSTLKKDWYPFVMCFDAGESFGTYIGRKDTRLTILYNFGAFGLSGHSSLYDRESDYYNSFYGAYLVQTSGRPYGFSEDGSVDLGAMAQVPRYDFSRLVLADFGLSSSDFVFDWTVTESSEGKSVAGYDDWTRITADLTVSSAAHNKDGFVTSYLQYGSPSEEVSEPFEPISMKGLIYVRYFPTEDTSVFLYALCTSDEVIEETEREFLMRAEIREE